MAKSSEVKFKKAYGELNPEQRAAVDIIYGPVMVIAGPGTGKTQLLAVRVCNIVAQTDMDPHNILCLTFTDAGAKAMRERLLSFMGANAYHVGVHTYHSFCNQILRDNPEKFSDYRDLKNASDIEVVDIIIELIDTLPLDHPMKRLKGEIYYDLKRYRSLFGTMKQEGWTPENVIDAIQEYAETLPELEDFKYKRKTGEFQAGDPNPNKIKKEMDRYENLKDSAPLIRKYQTLLKKRERIDYHDSIHFVIKALRDDDMLLAYYQERYQFILADEYQDTNGTQNELLFLLAGYDDQPNLFVVGDDDQSIYRFQGANMNNIVEFKNKFRPKEIVLTNNYRSAQPILDAAMLLIKNNEQRLSSKYEHLKKDLRESRDKGKGQGDAPDIFKFDTLLAQDIGIINKIKELVSKGTEYKDIGIIYRRHAEVEGLVKYMSFHNIPLNVKRKVDVLKLNDVKRLINILTYLEGEMSYPHTKQNELFSIMHYNFFNLRPTDIAKIAVYCSRRTDEDSDDRKYRYAISSKEILKEIGVSEVDALIAFSDLVESWIGAQKDYTIQLLFEMILTKSGLLNQILKNEGGTWRLEAINTLFNFIKEETAANPDLTISDLLATLDKMKVHGIPMAINKVTSSKEGINFMTAHASKGLEFKHVFIMNVTEEQWIQNNNKNSRFQFVFPPSIVKSDPKADEEDDRRLFYVALTRAKDHCYICYPLLNHNDRSMTQCRFFEEMGLEETIQEKEIQQADSDDYLGTIMQYQKGKVVTIDIDHIDRIVESLYMNATGVTKYLRCKTAFYFENILRVPMARTNNMGYGNAIHYALEKFVIKMKNDPDMKMPPLESLLTFFNKGMDYFRSHFTKDEYKASSFNGTKTLTQYYNERLPMLTIPRDFRTEYQIKTEFKGIPISGIIDRIDIHDHHIDITDYKTGTYNAAKMAMPNPDKPGKEHGGEQWRQVVFYKILLDNDNRSKWKLKTGIMDFVQPLNDKLKQYNFTEESFDIEAIYEQLKEVYEGIKTYNFSPGCEEEDCHWCNFVNENMSLESPLAGDIDEVENEYSIGE